MLIAQPSTTMRKDGSLLVIVSHDLIVEEVA